MDRKGIHYSVNREYLLDKDCEFDGEKLLEEMEDAKLEIYKARNMFNNVYDDVLIEIAIYSEDIAKKRYGYLLSIAKEKGISVSKRYLIKNNLILVQD